MMKHESFYSQYITGFKVIANGREAAGQCPFHEDTHSSFSVNLEKGLWKCHATCGGGNIVNFRKRLGLPEESGGNGTFKDIEKTYDYCDEAGKLLFQVCRMRPKDFRQRRPDGQGGWQWGLGDVRRILYRMSDLWNTKDDHALIVIVEGEKDVDALWRLGVRATTNPMGAGKWKTDYAEVLSGLQSPIVVIADNDEPGRHHALTVAKSCYDRGCKDVSILLNLPDVPEKGDISDWLVTASGTLHELLADAEPFRPEMIVEHVPPCPSSSSVKSLLDLANSYTSYVESLAKRRIQFGLPEVDDACRGLVPGEVAFILARQKVGKSAWVQNVLVSLAEREQASLFISMEQPGTMVFERHMQMITGYAGREIEDYWKDMIEREALIQRLRPYLSFCWTTDRGGVKVEDIPALVEEAKNRADLPINCVAIDYLGYLDLSDVGGSLYERMSMAARSMKRLAKDLDLPVIVLSQVGREVGGEGNLPLSGDAGRDTGAIEETADIEIGLYQPKMYEEPDAEKITLGVQVLYNRRGRTAELWYQMDRKSLRIQPTPIQQDVKPKKRRRRGKGNDDKYEDERMHGVDGDDIPF